MSSENARKRKSEHIIAAVSPSVAQGDNAAQHQSMTMMDEMKAMVVRMQDEMDRRLSKIDELEDKCQSMQSDMDLQRDEMDYTKSTLKLLTKSKNWEYSAPSIPSSHWTELG
eukprot:CAMPEP_0172304658 /NCGR_PEP_ID=MMETSP1058-20130122/6046_1 /TAXON_ID=83371 /ORGANISM="Detonula confervacea, Strain CCMP 353" /LENGTH=111 /DNA_ID=CAMNT_0013015987 /DNA_START=63 /DNA_END=395 /DNA_ORIENTATION=+